MGGALEAQASHQLRGTGWWDVLIESRAKGHAVAAWCCLDLDFLAGSRVPGVVEGEGASIDHLAPVVRVHGVLVLVLLAGRGIRGHKSGIVAICKVELDQGVSSPACSSQAWTVHACACRLN